MEITVKELEPCKLEVLYTADVDKILKKETEVLDVFKNAPVKGYRKGKAPLNVVKLRYKNQIHESLKRALIEEAYSDTVYEKNLNVLGQPEIQDSTLFNNIFTCKFGVLVRPEFDLKPFEYTVPMPHYTNTAENVAAKKLEELRRNYGDLRQFTDSDKVEMGDNVILNYTAYVDNKEVEGLKAEGDLLTVGASSLKEFDQNLVGMSLNENKTFSFVFGQSAVELLANKEVMFNVVLVGGSKVTPCGLDDSLAIKLGKADYNELHLQVNALAHSTIQMEKKQMLVDSFVKVMLSDYDFSVPDWMAIPDARADAQRVNIDYDTVSDDTKSLFLSKAKDVVKLSLILDKVRTEEPEAQLSEKEIYESVKNVLLTHSKISEETVAEEMKKLLSSGEFRMIAARLLDEHTIDFLLRSVKFVE